MTSTAPSSLTESTGSAKHSVRSHLLLPFVAYFLMLASTSFIAGGIVHLGLGENTTFYMALAAVGVVCFTAGNYLQEYVIRKNERGTALGKFLLVSFVLSVGIGMMTGGVQHFLDNPPYSTILIPSGLLLAVTAFAMREGLTLGRKVTQLISGTLAVAALLFGGLSALSTSVSAPAAHGHGAAAEEVTPNVSAAQHSAVDAPETAATPVEAEEAAHPVTDAADGHESEDSHAGH
ncbi:hypothetical protein DEDE109153_16335 [Deinococcus deserti]|uniref:Uncharacterized protein n=1 Tax=Deinococcus deserti (strain DSM 17065 / CIP 109153 / LMG 22923 / VCD115) TaxID=546414 RepID=C1D286_DEIDV|nr:hypothetical protein [Deinococcus deserti]ACO47525.1 Conserved hypothetical protein; putative membrane protein [Deinococcus deserti VCD115]